MASFASLTLGDCTARANDNFVLLRLIAAALVLFGHAYAVAAVPGLMDFVAVANWAPGMYTGSIAVDIFFVISGFLVTSSYLKRDDLRFFVRARFLRLVPALLWCVVLTALLFGPLMTTLTVSSYFGNADTWTYIWKNAAFGDMYWYLPGVFKTNPLPDVVNGSLWTLPYEMRAYLILALIGFSGLLARRRWASPVLGIFLLLCWMLPAHFDARATMIQDHLRLAGHFLLGCLCYLNRNSIRMHGGIAVLLIGIAWWVNDSGWFRSAYSMALAYTSLWFAYIPRLGALTRSGDYSYGLYLWGFPVQQIVAATLNSPSPMQVFLYATPFTLMLAMVSWHLIEQPALRLKNVAMHRWPAVLLARNKPKPESSMTAP